MNDDANNYCLQIKDKKELSQVISFDCPLFLLRIPDGLFSGWKNLKRVNIQDYLKNINFPSRKTCKTKKKIEKKKIFE